MLTLIVFKLKYVFTVSVWFDMINESKCDQKLT